MSLFNLTNMRSWASTAVLAALPIFTGLESAYAWNASYSTGKLAHVYCH